MADYHVTSSHICVEKPAAVGFTNTVMIEDTMEIERKDGRRHVIHGAPRFCSADDPSSAPAEPDLDY